ncbi:MAG: HAD family phosphatase [Bacteroidota bacterium]
MQLNLSKISHPGSEIPNSDSIINIIFDFGGVICNIDIKRTEKKFFELGLESGEDDYGATNFKGLFEALETGTIHPQEFRDRLRNFFLNPVTDEQLDDAWNALLLDIPEPRIRLLENLRKDFRIFLLSNSNEIHYLKFLENFRKQFGYSDFEALFEKTYFSFNLGFKKPSREIFIHVLQNAGLNPSETLFIDDTLMHVEGAQALGIHAHYLQINQGEQIIDLFTPA